MPAKELIEAHAKVDLALKLLDADTADEIVGKPQPEEYGTLIRGTQAGIDMLWMLARSNGVSPRDGVIKMWAQGQAILLTIVHYAYALGLQRGRGERA